MLSCPSWSCRSSVRVRGCLATPSNPLESGMATPLRARPTLAVARPTGRGQLSGNYDLRTRRAFARIAIPHLQLHKTPFLGVQKTDSRPNSL